MNELNLLPPCNQGVYRGQSVCLVDIPKETAELMCKALSQATGHHIDWHYIGGRVHIKSLAPGPIEDEREEFEKSWTVDLKADDWDDLSIESFMVRGSNGEYLSEQTRAAYDGWMNRAGRARGAAFLTDGQILVMAEKAYGQVVDHDFRGNPITDYGVLLSGAYGPAIRRLIRLARQHQDPPGSTWSASSMINANSAKQLTKKSVNEAMDKLEVELERIIQAAANKGKQEATYYLTARPGKDIVLETLERAGFNAELKSALDQRDNDSILIRW